MYVEEKAGEATLVALALNDVHLVYAAVIKYSAKQFEKVYFTLDFPAMGEIATDSAFTGSRPKIGDQIINRMKQINLFCPHCAAKVEAGKYRENLSLWGCVMCGGVILISDINLPKYINELIEKAQMEEQIRRLCVLTGKTFEEVSKDAEERNLTAHDLQRIGDEIINEKR
jgi:hypothetical protein